jgi:hypothetical protein
MGGDVWDTSQFGELIGYINFHCCAGLPPGLGFEGGKLGDTVDSTVYSPT